MNLRTACLAGISLAVLAYTASAQSPTLSHTAPQIGNPLSIELAGAAPGASVRLFFSPGEASAATMFGTLELERGDIELIASGPADPQGRFVHTEDIPLDPALAESWGHYQALVQDDSAPGGWVLSQGVHLRYLGTRMYETSSGTESNGSIRPPKLWVVSLTQAQSLGSISLGDTPWPFFHQLLREGDGDPVFSDDLSLGAVVAGPNRLVVFDNFRLEPRAVLPLVHGSHQLLPGLDGRSVVVLDIGAPHILWVDLPTGSVVDTLSLPGGVERFWTAPDGPDSAWVAARSGNARSLVVHVDLAQRQVLESLRIGPDAATFWQDLAGAPGRLFASSHVQAGVTYALSAVDLTAAPPFMSFSETGDMSPEALSPLLGAQILMHCQSWTFGPVQIATASSFQVPLELRFLDPPRADTEYSAFIEDEGGFWALHPCCDWDGGGGAILRYAFATQSWSEFGGYHTGGPYAIALARDDLTHQVAVAVDGNADLSLAPTIDVLEVASGQITSFPGGWHPIALHALTLP